MEIAADLTPILGGNMIRLDAMRLKQLQNQVVYSAINKFGELSAKALCLGSPLTSVERLMQSTENTLYLMWERGDRNNQSFILGMLKVGRKPLFLYDKNMSTHQGKVLSVLDFYVHFSRQRQGIGHTLFEFMLQNERMTATQLALDNPSVTLLAFMAKHYQLNEPIWQNTNYVVFPSFFEQHRRKLQDQQSADGVCAEQDGVAPHLVPEGWSRPGTPHHLGGGATETRWLSQMPQSKVNEMSSSIIGELTTEGNLANRTAAAKNRKQHILSSNPLW